MMQFKKFRREILRYYKKHKRDFSWRRTRNPYRIFISEIMLQQTQTIRVKKKYGEFLRIFPTIQALSKAPLASVLRVWQGMGYNRRALSLKKTSSLITQRFHGIIPKTREHLEALPGIGAATASAILAFAHNKPVVFLETNIRRVFLYFFFPKRRDVHDRELIPFIEKTLDLKNPRRWYYALMDYGAMLGEKIENPNRRSAHYLKQAPFLGSRRELRGKIIKFLLEKKVSSGKEIMQKFNDKRTEETLHKLIQEGFIKKRKSSFSLV
ncbi:MAG: A/G-specific adenine glycosylase [Patescibacteria group bacterium]